MSFPISLRSEMFKLKRTASFYLTLVAAAIVPFIFILDAIVDGVSPDSRNIIFNKMFIEGFKMTGFIILPMFIILISTLLPQIEFKNNTWKQVLTSPQAKTNIYLAKFLNFHFLILLFIVALLLLLLFSAVILHFLEPGLNVLNQKVDRYHILINVVNTYVVVFALSTIQFWLGFRFKNFIVPIAIGISMWFIGTLLVMEFESGFAIYFPYSFHVYNVFPKYAQHINTVVYASVAYAVIFFVLGLIDFNRKHFRA